jgi:CRP-like cAMP-binding protein
MKPIPLGIIGEVGPDFALRHCRKGGPTTSEKAAVRAEGFYKGHCARIESAMRAAGPCTAKDIAAKTGLSVEQVARRLPDLKDAGRVVLNGQEREGFRVWGLVR